MEILYWCLSFVFHHAQPFTSICDKHSIITVNSPSFSPSTGPVSSDHFSRPHPHRPGARQHGLGSRAPCFPNPPQRALTPLSPDWLIFLLMSRAGASGGEWPGARGVPPDLRSAIRLHDHSPSRGAPKRCGGLFGEARAWRALHDNWVIWCRKARPLCAFLWQRFWS